MENTHALLEGLLNIEVNTIVKHSMTAEKMPPLPFALLDIIGEYGSALDKLGVDLQPYFATKREDLWQALQDTKEGPDYAKQALAAYRIVHADKNATPDSDEQLLDYVNDLWPVLSAKPGPPVASALGWFSMEFMDNGWETFERLRFAAKHAREHITGGPESVVLDRITGSCARLKYILQGLQQHPPEAKSVEFATLAQLIPQSRNQLLGAGLRNKKMPSLLSSQDLTLVRKTWEVGVECVLMQTCVQIDGDVLTRISEELLREGAAQRREMIVNAHERSVEIGLRQWQALVHTAVELVAKLVS